MKNIIRTLATSTCVIVAISTPALGQDQGAEHQYDFWIRLQPIVEATMYEGAGSGKDALDQAWQAVCEKLPEADRPDCRNDERFHATVSSFERRGRKAYVVRLVPILPQFDGRGSSDSSASHARGLATQAACTAAGAQKNCVSTGSFEIQREIAVTRTTLFGEEATDTLRATGLRIFDVQSIYIDPAYGESRNPDVIAIAQPEVEGPSRIFSVMGQNGEPVVYGVVPWKGGGTGMVMSLFANNALHAIIGRFHIPGPYVFQSSTDRPLTFRCDVELGYVYVSGRGTVSLPDGSVLDLDRD